MTRAGLSQIGALECMLSDSSCPGRLWDPSTPQTKAQDSLNYIIQLCIKGGKVRCGGKHL